MMIRSIVKGKLYLYPRVVVNMTDEDIIGRVAAMFGTKAYAIPPTPGKKPAWRAGITGAGAVRWMQEVRPWMGDRRGVKIDEILASEAGRADPNEARREWSSRAAAGRPRSASGSFIRG